MQNFLLALTLPLLIQPAQLTKTYELPKSETAPIVRTCEIAPNGKPGLGLIKKTADESNRRRVLLELTPKGEALARQIKKLIFA